MTKERVAIVKIIEQNMDAAMQQIAGYLGDMQKIIPAGSKVLVKPNLVFPPTDRGVTHPELIEAVVRLVADLAPADIAIGEGSADVYTGQGFRFQKIDGIAARYGARTVDLNLDVGVKTPVPSDLKRDYIMVPQTAAEADVVISLPVFKLWNHPMSLSLKNFIGLYGGRYYGHNKDSLQRADDPAYAIAGDLGVEQGAHTPEMPASVVAMNLAVKTHLAIVDALEGGDGKGNFIRLNTLIAGTNPVATDTVALKLSGFDAVDYPITKLSSEHGLGPCTMETIETVGVPIAEAAFDLRRLKTGVLEMPLSYCLSLLNTWELQQIQRALHVYGLVPTSTPKVEGRNSLITLVSDALLAPDYLERAWEVCTPEAQTLLRIIVQHGGTSGSLVDVARRFGEQHKGLYYYPAHRILTRLGLAFAVDSFTRHYYLLRESASSLV